MAIDPATWTNVGSSTTGTSVTIPNLNPGTQYDFDVVATNAGGSATSGILTVTTISGVAPASVTGLSSTQASTTSLTLTWNASAQGSTPITYQPQLRRTGLVPWSSYASPISGTVVTITNLAAGTSYDFQIIAINSIGETPSATLTASTVSGTTAPSAPGVLVVGTITTTTIAFSWTASTGTAPITYQPQYRVSGQTLWINQGGASSALSTVFTGLSPSTSYELRIVASGPGGTVSSASQPASTAGSGTAPSAPQNLRVTAVTTNTADLAWGASATGSAPISYQPQYRIAGQPVWNDSGQPISILSATIPGLNSATTYDFRITAFNTVGSASSAQQTAATSTLSTAPGAPGTPVAWIITPTSVSLTWGKSASGTPPINYKIQARPTGTISWTLTSQSSLATSGSISGLTAGIDYDLQIVASNAAGVSSSNILTILAPVTGKPMSIIDFKPQTVLKSDDLDAAFNSKLDAAGGTVGPLQVSQTATSGSQLPMLSLSRTAGGVGDDPLISGTYTAVMADGPVVPYSSLAMTLTVSGDSTGTGPAGNVWNILGALNITSFRSSGAQTTGSQHAAVVGRVSKSAPPSGLSGSRTLANGWAVYAPATDSTGQPSAQGGGLISVNAPIRANNRDDADARYGLRITYGEDTPSFNGGSPAEFTRGLYVGAEGTTAYAKVIVDVGGNYSTAALDLRSANSFTATITSATPSVPVTAISVNRALPFASSGSPAAGVNATNPKPVVINNNTYYVVGVSMTPGLESGVLSFASPVPPADATQGNTVNPAAHTLWLSEGGNGALPGDISLNRAGTATIYYDETGGGAVVKTGGNRVTLSSTAAIRVPVGTTNQRPAAPLFGDLRANLDTGVLEVWQPSTSSWVAVGSGGTGTPTTGTAPGPAIALVAGTPATTSVPVSWQPPLAGSTPFQYRVQYRVSGISGWTDWGSLQPETTTTISGLTAGTRYDIQVLTTNAYGTSTSPTTSVTMAAQAPAAPTNLAAGSLTSTTVALTWTASATGTLPISYSPQYRITGNTTWLASPGGATTTTSQTISGLTASTSYQFQIVASNAGGTASSAAITASTTAPASVAPSVPTSFATSSPTQSSMVLTWDAPSSGTTPMSFQPYFRVTGSSTWSAFGSPITALTATVTGLSSNTSYDFQVTATNSAGSSTSAIIVGVTVATTPADNGTVSGSVASGTTPPVVSGPATGTVTTNGVLAVEGIKLTDAVAASSSGSCTLNMNCASGILSSTLSTAQVSGSGTKTINYVNTLSACQTVAANLIYTAPAAATADNVSVSLTNPSGVTNAISISLTVTAVGGGTPGGTIPTDATGTTANRAQTLINTVGVNTKLDKTAYQTATLSVVQNCINYLGGISVIRDSAQSSSISTWWPQVGAATSAKFIAYIPLAAATAFDSLFNNVGTVPASRLLAFEGCQEADTGSVTGFAETLAQAAAFQPTVWNGGVAYGIPVLQMSFGQGWNIDATKGNYGTQGDLSAYATYGNIHAYMPSAPRYNYSASNLKNFAGPAATPGKPQAFTEYSWNQTGAAGFNCTTEATAAVYALYMIMDCFVFGSPYTIWNGLLDDGTAKNGLFTSTGAARPAATAIKNLVTLLKDSNSNAITFTPGKLNYSISNLPTNAGALGGYHMLFQKSDGTFWIAIWNEQQLNNTTTGADITVANVTITLTLGAAPVSITVYDPTTSATAVQSAGAVTSLSISLPPRVLLVKVVHT